MSVDPIFNAFAATELVWAEVDRLVAAVPALFEPDLSLSWKTTEGLSEDLAYSRAGYHFEVRGAVSRQRSPGQLLLAFDLARPHESSSWPHARAALLTCAYSPRYETGWALAEVVISMTGSLSCQETYQGTQKHAGGRLLEWDDESEAWNRRGWLFSTPLLIVDGRDAFRREIVRPVIRLLKLAASPEVALHGTSAVKFS